MLNLSSLANIQPLVIPNPVARYQTVMDAKNNQLAQQSAALQLQQQQRQVTMQGQQDQEAAAAHQAIVDTGGDLEKALPVIAQRAPSLYPSMLKAHQDNLKMQQDIATSKAQAANFTSEAQNRETPAERQAREAAALVPPSERQFQAFYPDYLKANGLEDNAFNKVKAREALALQGKTVNPGEIVLGTNAQPVFTAPEKPLPPRNIDPLSPEGIRASAAKTLAEEQAKASVGGLAGAVNPPPPNATPDQILARYPSNVQALAKMMIQYKAQMPSGMALGNPKSPWNAALQAAGELDPTFDAKQYKARQQLLDDFTSGKAASNVRSINTAINHLSSLTDAANKLSNRGVQTWNRLTNAIESELGDPARNNFNINRDAVANELTTAFRGTGGNESDVKAWKDNLSSSASPAQLKEGIAKAVELLGGRIYALQNQYEQGMGRPKDFSILSPKSVTTLQKMGINPTTVETGPMNANNPSTQPFNATPAAKPKDPLGIRQ